MMPGERHSWPSRQLGAAPSAPMRAVLACTALMLVGVVACGSSGGGAAPSNAGGVPAPKSGAFVTAVNGDTAAVASPVIWDQDGIDHSWVGLFEDGDTEITVLPDPPGGIPFANAAIQVTDSSVLLLATQCPKPDSDAAEDGASCGPGEPIAAVYDRTSQKWAPFDPPPLPDGRRLGIGLIGGSPTFGVLAGTGPGGTAELAAYTLGPDSSTWTRLPAPPLADIADACVTDDGLVAVETSQFEGFINAGSKTFEEMEEERRQLETLDDGNMYAARFDPATSSWMRSKVTANRMVGTVDCQEPGIVYSRGDTELVVHPATGAETVFTATGEIGPSPSAVTSGDTLIATYWYDLSDPHVEQAEATGSKATAPVALNDVAYPTVSFTVGDGPYWAGLSADRIEVYPIATN